MRRPRIWLIVIAILCVMLLLFLFTRPAIAPHVQEVTPSAMLGVVDAAVIDGTIELEDGRCCAGGIAGETITLHAHMSITQGDAVAMRVEPVGSCTSDSLVLIAPFETFAADKTFETRLMINWVGFYAAAQFKDATGVLSPIVCDEISLEGMPAQSP